MLLLFTLSSEVRILHQEPLCPQIHVYMRILKNRFDKKLPVFFNLDKYLLPECAV